MTVIRFDASRFGLIVAAHVRFIIIEAIRIPFDKNVADVGIHAFAYLPNLIRGIPGRIAKLGAKPVPSMQSR